MAAKMAQAAPRTTNFPIESPIPQSPAFLILVHLAFALTGTMTVLLGPILPTLAAQWSLQDVQSGSLFAAQFGASVIGAAISLIHPRRSVATGLLCIAAGAALLAFATFSDAPAALAVMGFGLGLSITPMNLLVANANPHRRGAALAVLNACWGLGAGLAAQFVRVALQYASLRLLLLLLAACASALLLALWTRPELEVAPRKSQALNRLSADARTVLLFATLLFLYVGAENCVGGWVATYGLRAGSQSQNAGLPDTLVSLFWMSIVAVRFLCPLALKILPEAPLQITGALISLAGIGVLYISHTSPLLIAGVLLTGVGFAPVFPVSAAVLLARVGSTRNAGPAFAICGLGGAVLPWITGLISTRTGSLRAGFAAPALAIFCVLALTLAIWARWGSRAAADPV